MKHSLFLSIVFLTLFMACAEKQKPNDNSVLLRERILRLEQSLNADTEMVQRDSAQALLIAYQDFYNRNMQDTATAAIVLKAARLAEGLGKYNKAIELLVTYHDMYKTAPLRDMALYRVGFIYDEHLNENKNAEFYYGKVIELYPGSPWARDASAAIGLLNMSDEDIIKMLEQRNTPQ
jgi:tetratricopeptide (TPR) repeat protein